MAAKTLSSKGQNGIKGETGEVGREKGKFLDFIRQGVTKTRAQPPTNGAIALRLRQQDEIATVI